MFSETINKISTCRMSRVSVFLKIKNENKTPLSIAATNSNYTTTHLLVISN
jgi:hypothetical protein